MHISFVGLEKKNMNVMDARQNDEVVGLLLMDILTILKESGLLKRLKAENGPERENDVAEIEQLTATKNILPGRFTEVSVTLMKVIGKAISDGNSAVAVKAIQSILRNLEVEEPTIVKALTQTLEAMYENECLNLVNILEDVKSAVKHEVARVRSLTLNWLTFCLKRTNKSLLLETNEMYLPLCMQCLDDGTQEVRDAAFSALTALHLFSLSCMFTCATGSCCRFGCRGFGRHSRRQSYCSRSRGRRSRG